MKKIIYLFAITLVTVFGVTAVSAQAEKNTNPIYDAELAKKLGGDENGMKNYVFVILKTGPKDAEFKGKERQDLFAGHMANTPA
jgi:hypothetical protein